MGLAARFAYEVNRAAVLRAAANGGVVAFNLENTGADSAAREGELATLAVFWEERYVVIMEQHPWPTVRQVMREAGHVLVYGEREHSWCAGKGMRGRADFVDYQHVMRRPCEMLVALKAGELTVGAKLARSLPEAMAAARARDIPIFLPAPNLTAFHFPEGAGTRSVWDRRPLAPRHVRHATANVLALFVIKEWLETSPDIDYTNTEPVVFGSNQEVLMGVPNG